MSFDLCRTLQEKLTADLGNLLFPLPGEGTAYRAPAVYVGSLPPKIDPLDYDDAPRVVVRAVGGENREENGLLLETVKVSLLLGVFCATSTPEGEQHLLNLTQSCLHAVLQTPVLDDRFERLLPITWTRDETQSPPYLTSRVETVWRVPQYPPA